MCAKREQVWSENGRGVQMLPEERRDTQVWSKGGDTQVWSEERGDTQMLPKEGAIKV